MRREHRMKRILAVALALAALLAFPAAAYATDISVTANSTSVMSGDAVTVTVVVSGAHIAVADGAFTYDPALLSYIGSNGGASDGTINLVSAQEGGTSSLTAVIKFVAIGEGDAEVRVSMEHVLDYNGQALGSAEAGVSVSIASAGGPDEPATSESVPPVDISLTGVEAEHVMGATAPMYVWRSLTSLTLPSGFADRQVTYRDEYVGGAAIPDSEDLILLYLSEKTGENAGYYVYDAEKDVLFPYVTMLSVSASFTLIWPDESVSVPEGYEPATLEWKDREVPAWTAQGSDGSVYLVYARSSSGERALYLLNVEDDSVQRFIAPPVTEPEPAEEPAAEPTARPASGQADAETIFGIRLNSTLFIALCGACVLLAAAAVVFAVLFAKATRGKRRAARMEKRLKKASGDKDVSA